MTQPRFSIAALMRAVLPVALVFAALKEATEAWAGGVYLVTVLVLLTSLLGAVAARGEARFRWAGAAVFGVGYFLLVLATGVLHPPTLPTSRLIGLLDPANRTGTWDVVVSQPTWVTPAATPAGTAWTAATIAPGWAAPPAVRHQVGHCLFALTFALVGSVAAREFRRGVVDPSRSEANARPADPAPTPPGEEGQAGREAGR